MHTKIFKKREVKVLHPTITGLLIVVKRNFFEFILYNPNFATEKELKKYQHLNQHLKQNFRSNEPFNSNFSNKHFTQKENLDNIDKLIEKVKKNDLSKI